MAEAAKDTIYIDIDDEITSIIDKIGASKHKIVALVLPKRATMLQSVVNMKLLKRTATETKKNIVLITSESGLMPLAGAVGLHVAKTLQSKPIIPPPPEGQLNEPILSITDNSVSDADPKLDANKPVGELAGLPPEDGEETIELDNSDPVNDEAAIAAGAAVATKKNKKLKIPNFERFRTRLFLGIFGLIALLIGWYAAANVLPKASIVIKTDTESIPSEIDFSASAATKVLNPEEKVLPAELKEIKKTDVEKVLATGQKDVGTKASGTMALINCSKDDETLTVPAGTGVSSGNLTYITTESATIPASNFTGGGICKNDSSKEVGVVAQNAGDQYNLSPRAYTVAGFPVINGSGSAMSGGTTKIVKVVSDQDIENAKQKIGTRSAEAATTEVRKALQDSNLFSLNDTLTTGSPAITASPGVGQEATEVTVISITSYSMLGVKETDLRKLIEDHVNKQIDTSKQVIQDNGLGKAAFRILDKKSPGEIRMSVKTLSVAGPQIDIESLKSEISGKKRGDTTSTIQNRPGVSDVVVDYSPFWVFSTPKKISKITIIVEQSNGSPGEN